MVNENGTDLVPCAADTTVPGPTVLFWMVCFAMNALSQPYGRLCGLSNKFQVLLRTSPIILAFDAINVLVTWMASVGFAGRSWRIAATRILRGRFSTTLSVPDTNNPERRLIIRRLDVEGIATLRALKRQTKERLILFSFGAMPQFVKLFGSWGTPLIMMQVLGAMYLSSTCIMEGLLQLAKLDIIDEKEAQWMISVHPQFDDWHVRQWWGGVSLFVHNLVYAYLFVLGLYSNVITTPYGTKHGLSRTDYRVPVDVLWLFIIATVMLCGHWRRAWFMRESQPEEVAGQVMEEDIILETVALPITPREKVKSQESLMRSILYGLSPFIFDSAPGFLLGISPLKQAIDLSGTWIAKYNEHGNDYLLAAGTIAVLGVPASLFGMIMGFVELPRNIKKGWNRPMNWFWGLTASVLPFWYYTYS